MLGGIGEPEVGARGGTSSRITEKKEHCKNRSLMDWR